MIANAPRPPPAPASSFGSTCLMMIIITIIILALIIIIVIVIISSSSKGSGSSSYSGLVEQFCQRMPVPLLELLLGSMLLGIAAFCGIKSTVACRRMSASYVLPSFQPACCTFLLRTVLISMPS